MIFLKSKIFIGSHLYLLFSILTSGFKIGFQKYHIQGIENPSKKVFPEPFSRWIFVR